MKIKPTNGTMHPGAFQFPKPNYTKSIALSYLELNGKLRRADAVADHIISLLDGQDYTTWEAVIRKLSRTLYIPDHLPDYSNED